MLKGSAGAQLFYKSRQELGGLAFLQHLRQGLQSPQMQFVVLRRREVREAGKGEELTSQGGEEEGRPCGRQELAAGRVLQRITLCHSSLSGRQIPRVPSNWAA